LAPGSFIILDYENKRHDETGKTDPGKDHIKKPQNKK
jgi:hypothetical protein